MLQEMFTISSLGPCEQLVCLCLSPMCLVQSYMEDHLQNKDRLDKEWEALCSYQAEPAACAVGQEEQNVQRNRPHGVLVCECFANCISLELIYICFLVHYVVGRQHSLSQAVAFCFDQLSKSMASSNHKLIRTVYTLLFCL